MQLVTLNYTKNLITNKIDTSVTLDSGLVLEITDAQFAKLMTTKIIEKKTPIIVDSSEDSEEEQDQGEYVEEVRRVPAVYKTKNKPVKLKKSLDEFGFEEG